MTTLKPQGEAPKKHAFYDIYDMLAYYGLRDQGPAHAAIMNWISGTPKRDTGVTNGCILYWNNFPEDADDLDEEMESIPPVVEEFIKTCCEEFGEDCPISLRGKPSEKRRELEVYYWW